jgi:hypothetical protein
VLENRALRRIFGLQRDEVTGGQKLLHNQELFAKYTSNDQAEEDETSGHVARMGRRGKHMGYWRNCQKERDY